MDIRSFTHQVGDIEDITSLKTFYNKKNKLNELPLDGIVLKMDNLAIQKRLGHHDGTPYWALAWKFPSPVVTTTVQDIRWTIGRTGQITVLLELEPIQIQGVTLSTVSAGPAEYFLSLDIAKNDTVGVTLKGASTPVLGNILLRPKNRLKVQIPEQNQYSGLTCLSYSPDCSEQFLSRLLWLTGSHGMDIPGINRTVLEGLIQSGKLKQLSDVLQLTEKDISQEAIKVIQNHQLSLAQAILTLGIPEVGKKRSDLLADEAKNWKTIQQASSKQLQEWIKCSDKEAENIISYLHSREILLLVRHLSEDG